MKSPSGSDDRRSVALGEQGIVQRVRARLRRVRAPSPVRVVAGYSGGADSLVLLAALAALNRSGDVELLAIHVNHGLRRESSTEVVLAERVAGSLGVPIEVRGVDQDALRNHRGVGPEEAARRERYLLLASAARDFGAGVLALGHHERDQAETVLMHLARGAGLRGAAGMRETSAIEVPWWTDDPLSIPLTIWRPLLREPYAEVQRVAASLGLPFVTDSSNEDRSFRRNAVRLDVLPALESALPGATGGLARFASLAADDDDALTALAGEVLMGARDGDSLRRDGVRLLPMAVRRRVLIQWLTEVCPEVELSADRIEAVIDALDGRSGAAIEIGLGWSVVVRTSSVAITHR